MRIMLQNVKCWCRGGARHQRDKCKPNQWLARLPAYIAFGDMTPPAREPAKLALPRIVSALRDRKAPGQLEGMPKPGLLEIGMTLPHG